MYKRLLSMLLCLAMVLSFAVPVVNAEEVSATDSTDQSAGTDANVYLDGSIVVGDGGEVIFDNNIVIDGSTASGEDAVPTEPAEETVVDVCTCGNEDAALISHSDDCDRKLYYNAFCQKAVDVIYPQWEDMDEDVQAYVEMYLNSNYPAKWLELCAIIAENAPLTGTADAEHDGASVNASGIPEGSALTVQDSQVSSSEVDEMVSELDAGCANELFTWDISVQDAAGADWQPDGKVKLTLDLPDVDLNKDQQIYIMHKSDSGEVSYIPAELTEDGKITFETTGFSTFAGFTVDFAYDGVEFSINGYENILLSVLFEKLQMSLNVADVQEVTFTDYSLISIEKQDGDWLLTSLKAFKTTETLTIAMTNGLTHTIIVTDATYTTYPRVTIGGYGDSYTNQNSSDSNDAEDWTLTTSLTDASIDNSHTENYDIYIDATYATNKKFEFVLQHPNASSTTKQTLYLDLHTIWVRGGANVTIRLGGTITNTNTDKIVIRQVPGRKGNSSSGSWVIGELFYIEDGSFEIRPSVPSDSATGSSYNQSKVRIQIEVQDVSRDGTWGENKPFVALREDADYFRAVQCDFMYNNTSAITVRSDKLSEFTMTDCTFSNCYASGEGDRTGQGGAIYVHANPDVNESYIVDITKMTLTNVTFDGTYAATGRGGAITYRGRVGEMLLDTCTFDNTYASSHGGAVCINDDNDVGRAQGTIKFLNCTFDTTKATGNRGGAIRMVATSCTSFTVEGGSFTNCTAGSHGGAIAIQGTVSSVTISGVTVSGCKATANRGGFIDIEGTCSGVLQIIDSGISGCTSNTPGGAVNVLGDVGGVSISGSKTDSDEIAYTFKNCSSQDHGGAIMIKGNCGPFSINNATFTGNTADSRGGAVALLCPTVGDITLSNSKFESNTAGTLGGAIHVGTTESSTITVGAVEVTDCTFDTNVANSGVGGGLSLTDGTYDSVLVKNSSFTNCFSWNYGGAIAMKTSGDDKVTTMPFKVNGTVQILECSFSGCTSGNLSVNTVSDLNNDGVVDDNDKTWDHDGDPTTANITALNGGGGGGAICIGGTVVGSKGEDSTTTADDTGVIISGKSDADSKFQNCYTWNNGGAIQLHSSLVTPKVDFQYLEIDGCRARDAGNAVYLSEGIYDDLKMDNCHIKNCKYFTTDGEWMPIPTDYAALGKAVYAAFDAGGTFRCIGNTTCRAEITNCEFTGNESYGHGGAVYWNANNIREGSDGKTTIIPSLKITATTFDDNYTIQDGGGLYVEATVTVTGCEFKYNVADRKGGAITQQIYNSTARQLGEGEKTNLTLDSTTTIHDNTAVNGGGIAINLVKSVSINTTENDNLLFPVKFTLGGASVYENKATLNGGGIYYCTATYEDELDQREVDNFQKEILINSGSIYGNIAGYGAESDASAEAGHGGGIYMESYQVNTGEGTGYTKLTVSDGLIYSNKTLKGNGGGIYMLGENAVCTVTGGTIGGEKAKANTATPYDTGTTDTYGNAVYNYGNGGGIAIYGGATIAMTGGTISYNNAYVGGGIAVRDNSMMLSDKDDDGNSATISYNTATSAGGGIAIHDNSAMRIDEGTVSYNEAAYGGGISVMSSNGKDSSGNDLTYTVTTIDETTQEETTEEVAFGYGMVFNGGSVNNNTAVNAVTAATTENRTYGGGICLSNSSTMYINGGTISANKAIERITSGSTVTEEYNGGEEGGGIAVCQGSALTIAGGTISGNYAYNGGGVCIRGDSSMTMNTSTVTVNGKETTVFGTISGNTASNDGGGAYVAIGTSADSYNSLTINQGKITGNTASNCGAGVAVMEYSHLNINDGEVSTNTGAEFGGGIYIGGGVGAMSGGMVNQNTSTLHGGGIVIYTGSFSMNGGTVSYNEATGNGGGIYADNSADVKIMDSREYDANGDPIADTGKYDDDGNLIVGSINNNKAGKGGGIYIAWGSDLTVNNGFIIHNEAVGKPSDTSTAFRKGNDFHTLEGVGGGVCVANGKSSSDRATFTLTGDQIAIYGNSADFAADDVYANGDSTDLTLPGVSSMNLSGYGFPAVAWVEDYAYMDSAYTSGTKQASTDQGIANGQNVYRYDSADPLYRVMIVDANVDSVINDDDQYACLTLGIPSAQNDSVVIDFGLPVDVEVLYNDFGIESGTVVNIGAARPTLADGEVDFTKGTNALTSQGDFTFGNAELITDTVDGKTVYYVCYTPTSMKMDKQDTLSYAVMHTFGDVDYYFYSYVTIIPATTIYYEDNFIDYSVYDVTMDDKGNVTGESEILETAENYESVKWQKGTGGYSFKQDENRVGAGTGVYGYDSGYDSRLMNTSYGSSMSVTVSDTISARAKFTFTGTGFDVISRTDVDTGCIIVTVKDHNDASKYNKSFFVDTYFGYTYTEEGGWVVNTGSSRVLYQVPVMNVRDLDYGTYDVEIYVAYSSYFDNCYEEGGDNNSYKFYLDAIRIYEPANDGVWEYDDNGTTKQDTTIQNAYLSDGEYDPDYYELRDLILNPTNSDTFQSGTTVTGVLYLDGKRNLNGSTDTVLEDYVHYGPNNEIYLSQTNSVAFMMNFSDADVAKVQIALRRSSYLTGDDNKGKVKAVICAVDSTGAEIAGTSRTITLNSSTDLYHDISDLNGYTVVIRNASDLSEEISITNVKVTHVLSADNGGSDGNGENNNSYFTVDMEMANNVISYLNSQAVVAPTLNLSYPTVSFEDEIFYNVYFDVDDMSSVTEMGLITFDSKLENGTIEDAKEVIPGYTVVDGAYTARTNGIPAKNMGDAVYFKAYAKLSDGTYVYSDIAGYNAIAYANTVLNSDASDSAKALVVAMLNYGAAAQVQFGYNTDSLMNASLTAEQQALVNGYSADMMDALQTYQSTEFVKNTDGFTSLYPSVSFEGAFSINYYAGTANVPDGDVTFYYWDAATLSGIDNLTADNATGSVKMTADGELYGAAITGIAAKEMDKTVAAVVVFESNGVSYCSGPMVYSVGSYCESLAADGNVFAEAIAVYGYYAKSYFAN